MTTKNRGVGFSHECHTVLILRGVRAMDSSYVTLDKLAEWGTNANDG